MICFDASFTDVARRLGRQGAQLIAVPSLFGPSLAHLPHTQIVFRAIESRAAVSTSDVAFNSALIDAYGRVHELTITHDGRQAILVADLPLGNGRTLYARCGDWLGWACLGGLAVFALWIPLTLRQKKRVLPGSRRTRCPTKGRTLIQ
jgi:apolipoprotein N-acyltransferase